MYCYCTPGAVKVYTAAHLSKHIWVSTVPMHVSAEIVNGWIAVSLASLSTSLIWHLAHMWRAPHQFPLKEQVSRDESVVTPNELEILTREMVDPYPTPFLLSLCLKEISRTQFSLTHLHVGCLSRWHLQGCIIFFRLISLGHWRTVPWIGCLWTRQALGRSWVHTHVAELGGKEKSERARLSARPRPEYPGGRA